MRLNYFTAFTITNLKEYKGLYNSFRVEILYKIPEIYAKFTTTIKNMDFIKKCTFLQKTQLTAILYKWIFRMSSQSGK